MSNVIDVHFDRQFMDLIWECIAKKGFDSTRDEMIASGFNSSFVTVILRKILKNRSRP